MDDTPPQEKTKNLGKRMIIIAWVMIFGLLIWLFGNLEEFKRNPNQNVETTVSPSGKKEIILKSSRHGHYVATGKINTKKVTFLVDTGASYVSVPDKIATKLNLKKGAPFRVTTANGEIVVYQTNIDSISIGDIELYDIKADINPHMNSNEVLLGMSFLENLTLTHKDGELTIRQ